MDRDEKHSSPFLKLMIAHHEELEFLYKAIADPDRDSSSDTLVAERRVQETDLETCKNTGLAARDSCIAAGGDTISCVAAGKVAEGVCLQGILYEPEVKG